MNRLAGFAFVFGTLGCLLLISPVYAIAQDLPEAQRLERCENNQRYLADYDRQLEAVEAKLHLMMNEEELALARAHSDFVWSVYQKGRNENPAVREEQMAKIEELCTLYEFDPQKSCPRGLVYSTDFYPTDCLKRLHDVIRQRIETAKQAN